MEAIKFTDFTYYYPNTTKSAIENINLTIEEGEFILIVGPSGGGKSTLLRAINGIVPNFYGGKIKGSVSIYNKNLREYSNREVISKVGFVFQDPEKQIIFNSVERELAFGLENLGYDQKDILRNISEACALFGLNDIRNKNTQNISGGEKQKVEIASVIAMNPEIILFDEPTSQLDPISAEEVSNSIIKLNKDLGKTILVVEQNIDRFIEFADRILFVNEGKIIKDFRKDNIFEYNSDIFLLPKISQYFRLAGYKEFPISLKEANRLIRNYEFNYTYTKDKCDKIVLSVENLNFEFSCGIRTLKDISFNLNSGEVVAVMGQNGAGKTTLFKIISGLIDNYKGNVFIKGVDLKKIETNKKLKMIGYLAQNPNLYFGRDTVFEEVAYSLKNIGEYNAEKVNKILEEFNLTEIKDKNPRDLSGGQKQRLAIACVAILEPEILIFDEPTRGIDIVQKKRIGEFVRNYANKGNTVIVITHDSDFVGDYCDTTILMFEGEIVAKGDTLDVLTESIYYSPIVTKLFRKKCRITNSNHAIELLKNVRW
ncbi:putative HMP/thiamine import ATP-binding protein YkoD [Caloramator mitchellensis]|uniref:Putative HMP/thiamine import ATP-binding protein YkoD n=1 Tax=Caloramator mitchellensis TaxID=908809 RepID=A0A0R3K368_CALMK|nr:ABC transporter ATP-binding protein [Caloramator mitchellensis]KRQ88014.1 putative HMP/thiamine import ATP-binding protein YkoD [Caloramator mitchellensis]